MIRNVRDRVASRAVRVALALALVGYGVVGAAPHTHAEAGVPRLDAACAAASSPGAGQHLHGAATVLPPPRCLACNVGPGAVAVTGGPSRVPAMAGVAAARGAWRSQAVAGWRPVATSRGPPPPLVRA